MRTYAAFSLLALASGTAMAAPASPDLSRDVGFSSMPNSPDLSGSNDMAAFPPSMAATPETEDTGEDPLGSSLSGTKTADLAQKPALLGRAGVAYREYEKWVEHQKRELVSCQSYTYEKTRSDLAVPFCRLEEGWIHFSDSRHRCRWGR